MALFQLAGGLVGLGGAKQREGAAAAAEREAMSRVASVRMPTLEELKLTPEEYQYLGDLIAEQEQAQSMGPSRLESIVVSPQMKQAQLDALSSLQEQGRAPLSATERAQLSDIRRQSEGSAQARQQAILQDMATKGAGGSGAELAMRLQASQSEANRAQQQGENLAAMAQQRALEAISKSGALGGDIRRQEFGEQADVARAADEISRFNVANLQEVQRRNIERAMEAQKRNLEKRQGLSEGNVGLRNAAQEKNINQSVADWQRRYGTASDLAQFDMSRAANIRGTKSTAEKVGGAMHDFGAAADEVAAKTMGSMFGSSRAFKQDIKPIASEKLFNMVNDLDLVSFYYKPEFDTECKQKIGIIAEDSPDELTNDKKNAIDVYNMVFSLVGAIQVLTQKVEQLEKAIGNK